MAVFNYRALDSDGNEIRDELEALDSKDAIQKIRKMSLFPTKITVSSKDKIQSSPLKNENKRNVSGNFLYSSDLKCKLIRNGKKLIGGLNLKAENEKTYLVFTPKQNSSEFNSGLALSLDEMTEVKVSKFLGMSFKVKTTYGQIIVFKGSVGRIGKMLEYEIAERKKQKI